MGWAGRDHYLGWGVLVAQDFGALLVEQGKVSEQDLQRALQIQSVSGGNITQVLTRLGMVSENNVATLLSEYLGYPLVKSEDFPEEPVMEEQLPVKFLRQFQLLPLSDEGAQLRVAMADPQDEYAIKAMKMAVDRGIDIQLALSSDIESALERLYGSGRSQMDQIVEGVDGETVLAEDAEDVDRLRDMASDAPVIRLVNLIFSRALESRASDIHIEPFEHQLKVRYRIDGVLQEVESPPAKLAPAVISRLKILSRLNIAERRVPQDGRIKLKISGKTIDLRVSTVPTLYGESVVMRILDKEAINLDLDEIGLSEKVLTDFKEILQRPNGIFLVTGPTGSGKTTTLYAALSRMNTPDRKILTVEDPVEYQIAGVNQIQTASKIGLDFASALRAIVRQDPDVIMIGEMRDRETSGIAIQSALTGHIVFSTLHTNDAASGVTRLLDMGLADYLLTSTVNAIMSQRLVRVLCSDCKQPRMLDANEIKHMGIEHLVEQLGDQGWQAQGCAKCSQTGYRGRMGVHELLIVNDQIRQLILERASAEVIERAAREQGMVSMYEDGISKALAGQTSIEEVLRITRQQSR